jgi:hypothetical protein
MSSLSEPLPVVKVVDTTCQPVYTSNSVDFGNEAAHVREPHQGQRTVSRTTSAGRELSPGSSPAV